MVAEFQTQFQKGDRQGENWINAHWRRRMNDTEAEAVMLYCRINHHILCVDRGAAFLGSLSLNSYIKLKCQSHAKE